MGILRTMTESPEGMLVLLIIIAALSVAIMWLIIGAVVFAAIWLLFWQTIVPGLLMLAGIAIIFFQGFKEGGQPKWVIIGFIVIVAGVSLWAFLRWA